MKYDWILDVLTDLRTFADTNGLEALARQLDDTKQVAEAEIVSVADMVGKTSHGDDTKTGRFARGVGTSARA